MDIKQQTQNVANQGRYGDTMIMHVNPEEVRGLAQIAPITINPETGQPEAFLPFLIPMIASIGGGALFAGTALGALGGSALMSGLAQWAVTGDFKKGLLGAVTGYGVGSAMQAAGAAGQGALAGQEALKTETANLLANPAMSTPSLSVGQGITGAAPAHVQALATPGALTQAGQGALGAFTTDTLPNIISGATANVATGTPWEALKGSFAGDTPFRTGMGSLAQGASSYGAAIPMAMGMGATGIMESQEQWEADVARRAEEEE